MGGGLVVAADETPSFVPFHPRLHLTKLSDLNDLNDFSDLNNLSDLSELKKIE